MNTNEYAKLAKIETYYWWHIGRFSIIKSLLSLAGKTTEASILNIGSGTGGTVPTLELYGSVTNLDTSPAAAKFMKQRGYRVDLFDGGRLPYDSESFDILCAFDVLEHINDEQTALKEWLRVLKPGGKLVLTVPAYQWLWSEHDEAMHHFRRYTRSSLSRTLQADTLLTVRKMSYAFTVTLPLFGVARLAQRLVPHRRTAQSDFPRLPGFLNNFLAACIRLESRMLVRINLPAGTSVVAIAEKRSK